MSRILITGVTGFVGTHLAERLVRDGHEVMGLGRTDTVEEPLAANLASYTACDLTKPEDIAKLPLENITGIVNLAGLAAVGKSFDMPQEYMRVNTAVLSVICDEIVKRGLQAQIRMLAISSGAVYDSNQAMPLHEESKTNKDSSPYVASKLAMEQLAVNYGQKGLECIVARPFNHIGPGQGPGFLLPDLYAQLKEATASKDSMRVGNLTTKRDYTDVRDVVRAYVALITAPNLSHQVYNVCSGTPRSGEAVLQALIQITDVEAEVTIDKSKFRPSDSPILYGDHSKLSEDTGWQPKIPFEQSLADFVSF